MSSRISARRAWLLPAALTLLALAVRLPGLDGGLWADEIYSALYAFRTPFPASLAEFHGDNKHPFYSLLAHLSLSAFGESPWSLRLPALLFGVASVPMLFGLGARVTSRREAGFAAALLAVSYHHVWFSQNARGYTILLFCALASTWLLVRFLQDGDRRAGVLYGVCIAVGVYTHLTFVFTAFAQFIVAILALMGRPRGIPRPDWRWTFGIFAGGAALAIAIYAPMLERVIAFFLTKESALKGVSSPTWALGEALRMLRVGIGGLGVGGVWLAVGGVALCIAAAVGLAGLVSYLRHSRQVALLLVVPRSPHWSAVLLAGNDVSQVLLPARWVRPPHRRAGRLCERDVGCRSHEAARICSPRNDFHESRGSAGHGGAGRSSDRLPSLAAEDVASPQAGL
jgi:hypothetical protein